jgi:hypothetical protein
LLPRIPIGRQPPSNAISARQSRTRRVAGMDGRRASERAGFAGMAVLHDSPGVGASQCELVGPGYPPDRVRGQPRLQCERCVPVKQQAAHRRMARWPDPPVAACKFCKIRCKRPAPSSHARHCHIVHALRDSCWRTWYNTCNACFCSTYQGAKRGGLLVRLCATLRIGMRNPS